MSDLWKDPEAYRNQLKQTQAADAEHATKRALMMRDAFASILRVHMPRETWYNKRMWWRVSALVDQCAEVAAVCSTIRKDDTAASLRLKGTLTSMIKHFEEPTSANACQPFDTPKPLSLVIQRHEKITRCFGSSLANMWMWARPFHVDAVEALDRRILFLQSELESLKS